VKQDFFFYPKKFLHNIQEGVSYGDLTKDAVVLLLNEYLIRLAQPFFLVLENEIDAGSLYLCCEEFCPNNFVFFPSSFDNVPGFNLETNRLKKDALLKIKGGLAVCCITTNEALHEPLENNKKPVKKVSFRAGEKLDVSSVISSFSSFGYSKKKLAIKPGSFAVQGDVVDVFPSHFKNPFRLSLN
jgi:Transcription-repair coupling factor (superfamily II helicase)